MDFNVTNALAYILDRNTGIRPQSISYVKW